jgi:hypothetical protein
MSEVVIAYILLLPVKTSKTKHNYFIFVQEQEVQLLLHLIPPEKILFHQVPFEPVQIQPFVKMEIQSFTEKYLTFAETIQTAEPSLLARALKFCKYKLPRPFCAQFRNIYFTKSLDEDTFVRKSLSLTFAAYMHDF